MKIRNRVMLLVSTVLVAVFSFGMFTLGIRLERDRAKKVLLDTSSELHISRSEARALVKEHEDCENWLKYCETQLRSCN